MITLTTFPRISPFGYRQISTIDFGWLVSSSIVCQVPATGDSADALGIAETAGTILPGKRADLIAVAGNPLEDIIALRDMRLVVARGRIIKGPG